MELAPGRRPEFVHNRVCIRREVFLRSYLTAVTSDDKHERLLRRRPKPWFMTEPKAQIAVLGDPARRWSLRESARRKSSDKRVTLSTC